MKYQLTEQDIEILKALHDSALGNGLIKYLESLVRHFADIRTLEGTTEEHRKGRIEAIKLIEEHLINRIKLQNFSRNNEGSEYI